MIETPDTFTAAEQKNIELVKEYMQIAYDPERASASAVAHLCAPNNRFIAPSTFPEIHTLEQYAEGHGAPMKAVNDLHLISFDVLFAHADRVCLRYTAESSHSGGPHGKFRRPAVKRAGRPPPFSASRTESSPSSLRTGTSWRCGSNSDGPWGSVSHIAGEAPARP